MESSDRPVAYIESITQRYANLGYTPYRWFEAADASLFTPLKKPLSRSKLGLLTTSGCYVAGQVAFHYKDDASIRRIPVDTPADRLRFSHITENYLADAREDPECLVPLAALHRLRAEGAFGSLADEAVSCMGGVYSQRRVREELIPQITAVFKDQDIDAALLVPM